MVLIGARRFDVIAKSSFQLLSAAIKPKPKGHILQSFQTPAVELPHGSSFPLSVLKPPTEKVLILTHQAMNREKRLIASDWQAMRLPQ